MAISQVTDGLGDYSVKLSPDTPRSVTAKLDYLGHLCISAARDDPRVAGDSLLRAARFVGPLRGVASTETDYTLTGSGMSYWLGDEDNKGGLIETPIGFVANGFEATITALLPPSVRVGNLYPVTTGTFTGLIGYQTPRKAIDFVCKTLGAVWRVNGDGTIDAGPRNNIFRTTPQVAIIRRRSGSDINLVALPGTVKLTEDIQDYTTKVILYGTNTDGVVVALATATLNPSLIPFRDLFGNIPVLTRLQQETTTDQTAAPARAAIALATYNTPRDAATLTSSAYDITGDLVIGDSVWVYDPDAGLYDTTGTNEIIFQGERVNPAKLIVNKITWPVVAGMGVAFRSSDGSWTDLTDYLIPESGDTQIEVGGYNRSLVDISGGTVAPGSRTGSNTSVPNAPAFTTPFVMAVYQAAAGSGITKAQIQLVWVKPTNTDGSAFIDGAFYEVRYRRSGAADYAILHLSTDTVTYLLQELTPGVTYEFQIRAIDNSPTPNYSVWSGTTTVTTPFDTIAPAIPAAPSASTGQSSVQIVHTLGAATGGAYNLSADLNHLRVHASSYNAGFTTSESSLIGRMPANLGMMLASTPAVATFQMTYTGQVWFKVEAVDESGNISGASASATSTSTLIPSANISDLTASKITAGSILATLINAAKIASANSGQRYELDAFGYKVYDAAGNVVINLDSATASALITGVVQTSRGADSITMTNATGAPEIQFLRGLSGTSKSYITAVGQSTASENDLVLHSGPDQLTPIRETRLSLNPDYAELVFAERPSGAYRGPRIFISGSAVAGTAAMEIRDPGGSGSLKGGQVTVDNVSAYLAAVAAGGTVTNFINMVAGTKTDMYSSTDAFLTGDNSLQLRTTNAVRFFGRIANMFVNTIGADEALFCGEAQFTYPGGTSWTAGFTYGPTMTTAPSPFVQVDGQPSCKYTSYNASTTGFRFETDSGTTRFVRFICLKKT